MNVEPNNQFAVNTYYPQHERTFNMRGCSSWHTWKRTSGKISGVRRLCACRASGQWPRKTSKSICCEEHCNTPETCVTFKDLERLWCGSMGQDGDIVLIFNNMRGHSTCVSVVVGTCEQERRTSSLWCVNFVQVERLVIQANRFAVKSTATPRKHASPLKI